MSPEKEAYYAKKKKKKPSSISWQTYQCAFASQDELVVMERGGSMCWTVLALWRKVESDIGQLMGEGGGVGNNLFGGPASS